jgi:hypothetical protein
VLWQLKQRARCHANSLHNTRAHQPTASLHMLDSYLKYTQRAPTTLLVSIDTEIEAARPVLDQVADRECPTMCVVQYVGDNRP